MSTLTASTPETAVAKKSAPRIKVSGTADLEGTRANKITLRNSTHASRGNDGYTLSPLNMVANKFLKNTREVYFETEQDWADFKADILENGVQQTIIICTNPDNEHEVFHGYRRFEAVAQLVNEGKWAAERKLNVKEVPYNMEEALISHIRLNKHKQMTDMEVAKTLHLLEKAGLDKKAISERTLVSYQKVVELTLTYAKASERIRQAVANGITTISVAKVIVQNANGTTEQNKMLDEGLATVTELALVAAAEVVTKRKRSAIKAASEPTEATEAAHRLAPLAELSDTTPDAAVLEANGAATPEAAAAAEKLGTLDAAEVAQVAATIRRKVRVSDIPSLKLVTQTLEDKLNELTERVGNNADNVDIDFGGRFASVLDALRKNDLDAAFALFAKK